MTGDEDDREIAADVLELVLELKTRHGRHAHVKENAARTAEVGRGKERAGVAVFRALVVFAREEERPRGAHGAVVVDDADEGLIEFAVHHFIRLAEVLLEPPSGGNGRKNFNLGANRKKQGVL